MTTMTLNEVESAFPTWHRLTRYLGRNDLPDVLMRNWRNLELDELAYAIDWAWHMAEFPERPANPVQLWRGATQEGRAGMAWSSDRATAEWFRDRLIYFGLDGRLWTSTPTTRRHLMSCSGRNEHEVVINASGLDIKEVSA
ncbi:hypothetical protein [Brevibacterium casei]|uniref:hypothetical protein n=1 Tax=Brevibacterium casei TaxID=33889 RepID=UPI00241C5B0E|nr:hypothetical protein [Brevibacterium casei]